MKDSVQIAQLKKEILEHRKLCFPPTVLSDVPGLPLFYGSRDEVDRYTKDWESLYVRANSLDHPLDDELDFKAEQLIHVQAHYALPIIARDVTRILINKTLAKESINFRSYAALTEKCGTFNQEEVNSMIDLFDSNEDACLVGHRPYNDLRAYLFFKGQEERVRIRFYNSGLILSSDPNFGEIIIEDNRLNRRKTRSDAYTNPIAQNGDWLIYEKNR